MEKLLVITDLHVQANDETIIEIDPSARLARALDHAVATHPNSSHLILTGDLTHHGQIEEYRELKSLLDGFPIPIIFLLGNHDKRANFLNVFPETPLVDGFVQTSFDTQTHHIITLDSLDEGEDNPIPHSGYLCSVRLDWLASQLAAAKDKDVIVFIHHPPVKVGFDAMDAIALRNDRELRRLLAKHGNVKHVIAGHVHRTISGSVDDLSFSIFKSPCHQMPMVEHSADSSLSTNEPGAYGILFLNQGQIVVHSEDFETAISTGSPVRDPYSG